jgi:membrane protein required for colicin V production
MLDGLTGFDYVVLALAGLFLVAGLVRGFVSESLTLGAWLAAAIAVRLFHEPVTGWLEPITGGKASAAIVAFLLLFFGVLLAGRLLASTAGRATRSSMIGPLDRMAGGAFGLFKALVLATVIFMTVRFTTGYFDPARESPDWLTKSASAPFLDFAGSQMVNWLEEARDNGFPKLPEGHPPIGPFRGGPDGEVPATSPEPGYSPEANRRLEELIEKGEAIEL